MNCTFEALTPDENAGSLIWRSTTLTVHEFSGAPGEGVPAGGDKFRQQMLGLVLSTGPAGVAVAAGATVFAGFITFFVDVGVFDGTRVRVGVVVGVGVSVGVNVVVGVFVADLVGVHGSSPSKFLAVAVGTGSSMATFMASECSSASSGERPRSRMTSLNIVRLMTPKNPSDFSPP